MKDKTLHEIVREQTKANSVVMKHMHEAHNAFEAKLQQDSALQEALVPSERYSKLRINFLTLK